MRLGLMVALATAALWMPLASSAGASGAHGPTTIVKRQSDGTHRVTRVENRDTYWAFGSDRWNGYIQRPLTELETYQHVDWSGSR
ncbi:hypothetical protein [Synechococcus sp. PCC 7336]|uniref:hypothetical protein n=1 Tax=Synechococcus sp. PCC 7336 TaxID=195250 RepID=UPI000344ED91|nr:hypothetical protein [Synechococcus sp. PCC 7336]